MFQKTTKNTLLQFSTLAYVCDSAAMQRSSQIALGRLVIVIIIIIKSN